MKLKVPAPKSIETLEADAASALKHRAYKDAIALFKDLLKREPRAEWKQNLAEAYLQRARQVAEKGMYQEAAVLWDSHAQYRAVPVPSDEYIGWLLRAGQHARLAEILGQVPEDSALGQRLPEVLGLLCLENEKLLAKLPAQHPVVKHHPLAKRALAAYGTGKDAELEELLRQIPMRSPYRNLRTLLKALPLLERDRAEALPWLDKIEAGSACRGLADLLARHGRTTAPGLIEANLSAKRQTLLTKLNGYSKAQVNLLKEMAKLGGNASPRRDFETALKYADVLGEASVREFCRALLVEYPGGRAVFERKFGRLPHFEQIRLQALHEESCRNRSRAGSFWNQYLQRFSGGQGTPEPLNEALVHRHIAALAKDEAPEVAAFALESSLQLDPDDKQSYLELVRLYEEKLEDSKAAQKHLELAIKRYPRDVDFLKLAMANAAKRKAFKKAAGYAKTVLEIDPINHPARRFLIDAHLGHARKQFRAKRTDLARQEMEQARALDPQRRNAALGFLEGLMGEGTEEAARLLEQAWQNAGGGLCAQLQLTMEMLGLDVSPKGKPGLDAKYSAGRDELAAFAKLLDSYAEDPKRLADALAKLKPILKRSFKQAGLPEPDFLLLCQAFAKHAQYGLLQDCVQEAIRNFPMTPGPVYYDVLAQCKGQARNLSEPQEERLHLALDLAEEEDDDRMIALIDGFLRRYEESLDEDWLHAPPPPGFEDMEFDESQVLKIMKKVMEMSHWSRDEMLHFIAGDGMKISELQGMNERDLMDLAIAKLFAEGGLSPDSLPGLSGIFGGSSRKSR